MDLYLKIWRQKDRNTAGKLIDYKLKELNPHMSFLEMLDTLNEKLITAGEEPVEFDHDCREGICGMCSMVIDGKPYGPWQKNTVCQLHMRAFNNGDIIVVEPWRAKAFKVVKDLVVDRTPLDRIVQAGGYISVNTGSAQDANNILIPKKDADDSFAAAACIGCGACVAACKNSSALLFTSAKVTQLALLPQGDPERKRRVVNMIEQMDKENFGACTATGACEAACPKGIRMDNIARLNKEYLRAVLTSE